MSDPIPDMNIKSGGGIRLSIVWIVPVVAVLVALAIAWQTYSARGPVITISFEQASGIIAGQTELRYRAVKVGTVEELDFSEDLTSVVAHVRVDKQIAHYIDEDARFWLVQPQVSTQGVTGLDTVLTGVFIEGSWDSEQGDSAREFEGSDSAPLIPTGQDGTVISLRAEQGGRIQTGAPVVYRGVTIGEIDTPQLAPDGSGVTASAFIRAPYDGLISTNSRFWSVGGFSVNVGPNGLRLDVGNIASLIQGGITFANVGGPGEPIGSNAEFNVFYDEGTARNSVTVEARTDEYVFSTIFDGALGGLEPGAPVELSGLQVGQVLGMTNVPSEEGGQPHLRVDIGLRAQPLGLAEDADEATVRNYIGQAVEGGLRAELTLQSLFSGGLKVVLAASQELPPGELDVNADPYPIIPSMPSDLSSLNASAEGIANRIANLPVEELMASAVGLLDSIRAVLDAPGLREAPEAAVGLMNDARAKVEAIDLTPLMADVQGTVSDLRQVIGEIGSDETLGRITSLLEELDAAASELGPLLASARSLTDTAAQADIAGLVDSASTTLSAIGEIASSPEAQALPGEIGALLSDARTLLASSAMQSLPAEAAETIATADELLAQIRDSAGIASALSALERLDAIAAAVETTASGLPELRQQLSGLVTKIDALDLDTLMVNANGAVGAFGNLASAPGVQELPSELQGLVADARALLASPAVQALPQTLSDTIADAGAMIAQVQESDSVQSLVAALERVDTITASVAEAADGLPELRDQVSNLVAKADGLPVNELMASADQVLQSSDRLLNQPGTQDLPGSLSVALDQLSITLEELRAGGTVENVNATLQSAADAADQIAAAAESLPELTSRLNQLVLQGETLMSTYGDRSRFNSQALGLLSELREAAKAVTSLSRTIERNPAALIRGR